MRNVPRRHEIAVRAERPRAEERVGGVDLDSMSERELERLHAGLVKPVSMEDTVLAALVEQVLAREQEHADRRWHPLRLGLRRSRYSP